MNLLIIESPGKQKTIQGFLGSDWRVIASMGHIRGLSHDLNFLERDFEPTYEFLKEKSKAITALKDAAKGAKEIYLAADRDFEGEQIAYSVKVLLKLPANTKRITFTEITEKAIRHAIQNPGTIDMDRVHTQQARSMLDLLIGFTMSPLLWKHVAPSLSAGRCQIPSIRLVVDREDAIQQFKTESSWALSGVWEHEGFTFNATMDDDLEDEESVVNYMENVVNTMGTVSINQVRPWSQSAPEPLMTSTLQQQASAIFHMNPKTTMSIAQKLYEAGHITYMRTDKAVIAEDAVQAIKEWIHANYGEEFINTTKKKVKATNAVKAEQKDQGPNPQEAHEAIRPTHIEVTAVDGEGASLYKLIWQRTVQSCMAAARGEIRTVMIILDDFTWTATWKRTLFPGWKAAGKVASLEDEKADDEDSEAIAWENAAKIQSWIGIKWQTMKAEPIETKAKGRFTEATLIRELEKHGIGRPSTFASLLATIQEKNYVETRDIPPTTKQITEHTLTFNNLPITTTTKTKKVGAEKQKLVPTELGRSVLHFLLQHFDDLFAYDFTRHLEQRLDHVADGTEDWKAVVRDSWMTYKERYELLNQKVKQGVSDKVKEFQDGVKAVQSKKGPLLLREGLTKDSTIFFGWPQGVTWDQMTEESAQAFIAQQQKLQESFGTWNDNPIERKTGKFGDYFKCGEISIPFKEEPLEETIQRLEAKSAGAIRQFKEYTVRAGQYGPYIMKTSVKKSQFISLPKGLDPATLSEKDVERLYKEGVEQKKTAKKLK